MDKIVNIVFLIQEEVLMFFNVPISVQYLKVLNIEFLLPIIPFFIAYKTSSQYNLQIIIHLFSIQV